MYIAYKETQDASRIQESNSNDYPPAELKDFAEKWQNKEEKKKK